MSLTTNLIIWFIAQVRKTIKTISEIATSFTRKDYYKRNRNAAHLQTVLYNDQLYTLHFLQYIRNVIQLCFHTHNVCFLSLRRNHIHKHVADCISSIHMLHNTNVVLLHVTMVQSSHDPKLNLLWKQFFRKYLNISRRHLY